jgi:hypothetical protein
MKQAVMFNLRIKEEPEEIGLDWKVIIVFVASLLYFHGGSAPLGLVFRR